MNSEIFEKLVVIHIQRSFESCYFLLLGVLFCFLCVCVCVCLFVCVFVVLFVCCLFFVFFVFFVVVCLLFVCGMVLIFFFFQACVFKNINVYHMNVDSKSLVL